MFTALRSCWVPPPKEEARHGMEYTIRFAFKRDGTVIAPPRMTYSSHDAPSAVRDVYRDAIDAALKRCTPLHLSGGMAGAVAGRPIAIRFVDDRTIDQQQNPRWWFANGFHIWPDWAFLDQTLWENELAKELGDAEEAV
jgi:hypothetical protein